MDWNDLKYLLALKRAGTLAGAARALAVDHSTVSRRLVALEDAIGSQLLRRTPDGLFVFIPKYRKPILRGQVAQAVRDLVRKVCKA